LSETFFSTVIFIQNYGDHLIFGGIKSSCDSLISVEIDV